MVLWAPEATRMPSTGLFSLYLLFDYDHVGPSIVIVTLEASPGVKMRISMLEDEDNLYLLQKLKWGSRYFRFVLRLFKIFDR